ncbi:Uncharacterized conserved protein, DUF302 family [Limimonas halophila]|uniref:Uncharacterized conserved protein, DUF302 family n=1 Tax=Limimonas halophila TaxID=1082479 RepID=A0A1G7T2D6_9PROT|nr:DUF302 domain-containing protein [Limimonas halophila]SDG29252.1 Uncharacterized conserved protein, DUF302 family [Limimonas halophila]
MTRHRMTLRATVTAPITALALAAAAPASAGSGADGLIKVKSEHSVETTLDRLASALESKGLTVFARVDHRENAKGADLDLPATQVLIFGNPKLGTPLMQAQRSVAIDLPQKALAYQDDEGQVWLAYNDPAYLAERHGLTTRDGVLDKIGKALKAFAAKATQ